MGENIALTEAVFYILLSVTEPLHGYGIMQKVEQMSHGRVNLAAGTLYGATSTLVERGWIEPAEGDEPRRKAYHITELGLTAARQELDRLRELVANGEQVLERGR